MFLDAAIALAQKVTDAPSLEAITKDLKEIKDTVQNQTKQQLQLIKAVNTIEHRSAKKSGLITPVARPPRSYLEAARRGAASSGSYASNNGSGTSPVGSTVTGTSGTPALPPLAEDLEIHVRKTTPAVVNPLRRNHQALVIGSTAVLQREVIR
jgi:hypothetical protein